MENPNVQKKVTGVRRALREPLKRPSGRKKKRVFLTAKGKIRSLQKTVWGNFYVKMAKANMFVSVGDSFGNILLWESGGTCGYKGKKKASWLAGRVVALKLCRRAFRRGIREAKILVNGYGKGRRSAVRAIGGYLPPKGYRQGGRRRRRRRRDPSSILSWGEGRGRAVQSPFGEARNAFTIRRRRRRRGRRGPLKAFKIRSVTCNTRLPHNGCRKPRKRHLRRRPPRRLIDLYAHLLKTRSPWARPKAAWLNRKKRERRLRLGTVGRKGFLYPAPGGGPQIFAGGQTNPNVFPAQKKVSEGT